MKNKSPQFDLMLEHWAKQNDVESLLKKTGVFVVVDKYNKPIESDIIPKSDIKDLPHTERNRLSVIKKKLPYENTYFSIVFDEINHLFLVRKKTPIQTMLNVWALVIIIWALYRWYFRTSLPNWFDEFIAKPIVFIGPIYYFITHFEKKSFFEGVNLDKKITSKSFLSGIILGLVFFLSGLLSYFFKHHSLSLQTIFSHLPSPIWLIVLISFATSISEEILSRGFVLKRLYEDSKNIYTSSLYTSVLFFFMHIPILFTNDKIIGVVLFQVMLTDLLFSFAVSFLYLETRSLYLPILIHALYNISIYLFSSS